MPRATADMWPRSAVFLWVTLVILGKRFRLLIYQMVETTSCLSSLKNQEDNDDISFEKALIGRHG